MSGVTPPPDMLSSLFQMQCSLNDVVFQKHQIQAGDGTPLTMSAILDQANSGKLGVNDLPNQWLTKYAEAISSELDPVIDLCVV